MALDIFADEGTTARFVIHNNGSLPLSFRYRIDCADYDTGTPSSAMVEVSTTVGVYLFRYTHINVAADIPKDGKDASWSSSMVVLPGRNGSKIMGTLCEASLHYYSAKPKELIPGWVDKLGCDQDGGTTDIGGLCSAAPHLHQAASNGKYDGCLSANAAGDCGHTRGLQPSKIAQPPIAISTSMALFYA